MFDLVRKRADFFNQGSFLLLINRTLCSCKCYGKNIACNKLCAVGLGCGNCDLRSCKRIQDVICFSCNGRAHYIDNCQRFHSIGFGKAKRCQRIRSLPGLADNDRHAVRCNKGVPVTEFRSQFNSNLAPCKILDHILDRNPYMIGRAAADDIDLIQIPEHFLRKAGFLKINSAVLADHRMDRVLYRTRLFMNLLQHEVRISALLRRLCIHLHLRGCFLNFFLVNVIEGDLVRLEDAYLHIVNVIHRPGVFQDGRNIRCKIGFSVSDTDDHRRILSCDKNFARIILDHNGKCVGAAHAHHHMRNCMDRSEIVLLHIELNQVDDHLGIRVGIEMIVMAQQLVLDILIVLNNAVVNTDNRLIVADMRMRIVLTGFSVCRPARVTDSAAALYRKAVVCFLLEDLQPALGFYNFEVPAVRTNRESCRIITTIFQLGQTIQKDRRRLFLTYISDNSTHSSTSCRHLCGSVIRTSPYGSVPYSRQVLSRACFCCIQKP